MNYPSSFHDNQPIWWVRRVPIYVTTVLIALFIVGMIVTTFVRAAGFDLYPFMLSMGPFWLRGWYWEPLTSVFLAKPDFFFIIGMFFFYNPAVEVEKYLGRRRFLTLLGLFLLTPLVVLTTIWKGLGAGSLTEYSGQTYIVIGMFIAFATLYPNMDWFGWIPLKWVAFMGLALVALSCLPDKNWVELALHFSMAGVGFGYVRFLQIDGSSQLGDLWKRLNPFRRRPKFHVVPKPEAAPRRRVETAEPNDVDALLDKIARTGIGSLTPKERARLEQAREALMRKDQR